MTTAAIPSTERLRALIGEELTELVTIRRDLHAHPELGYEEVRTSEVVRRELGRAGVTFVEGLAGGTGVVAHLPGAAAEAVGLRADMDALPIAEETGAAYASTRPGVMHACGHDGHTTMLIGAARILARLADGQPLARGVTLVFQPAEEGGGGGRRMVEDGCLDGSVIGPPVQRIFGLHGWPWLDLGTVGTRPGPLLAAADMFTVRVHGRGGHAAWPQRSRDPVVAASAIVLALQTIASRATDPLDPVVVSATQINAGTAHNIIPDRAEIAGTVRTVRPETQQLVIDRLRTLAERTAEAYGCRAELDYQIGYPVTFNDPGTVARFEETARRALGDERVVTLPHPVMGAEDFAFYGRVVPACFFVLGLRPPGRDAVPELHQATFDFNDEAIPIGVEMLCRVALEGGEAQRGLS